MAILTSESPNITIKEIDLSGTVPGVTSSTGAFVGDFSWGPINQPILVSNEADLIGNFGSPAFTSNSVDYLSASTFLKSSSNAYIVRASTDVARNAVDSGAASLIENLDDFDTLESGLTGSFYAKYAGAIGNSLQVSVCGALDSSFDNWAYASSFDARPDTSAYVAARSVDTTAALDEVHVAIIDEDGLLSGQRGTVLETFENVSVCTDAKGEEGGTNYILDVLNNRSSYVYAPNLDAALIQGTVPTTASAHTATANGTDVVPVNYSLTLGVNSAALDTGAYTSGYDKFEDENTIQVDLIVAPGMASDTDQTTVVNHLTAIAIGRKDCVVVASPARDDVVGVNNPATITTSIVTWANGLTASSYLILDNNYTKVYDKFNDKYVDIPAAAGTAGTMASTDNVSAPWFSPAGSRRGQYLGVTSLAWNATKAQRDTLYKASVNPIVNLPGQGIILYGDKTKLGKPSAFNRINVRRLFLVVERAIKGAAQNVLFEFNDEFTRAEFTNIVEPFLREIKGRRGISDFQVVCDETNNTSDIIDNNQFVASVFIKPARSINYVTLNFVAVRTGVDFDEVVGIV